MKSSRLAYTAIGVLTGLYLVGPIKKLPYILGMVFMLGLGYYLGATDFVDRVYGVISAF